MILVRQDYGLLLPKSLLVIEGLAEMLATTKKTARTRTSRPNGRLVKLPMESLYADFALSLA